MTALEVVLKSFLTKKHHSNWKASLFITDIMKLYFYGTFAFFLYCSHFTKAKSYSGLSFDSSFRRVPNNASKLLQNHCQVQLLMAFCLNILCLLAALLNYGILDRAQ